MDLKLQHLIYEREKLKHIPIIFITANIYGDENIIQRISDRCSGLYL